MPLTKEQLEQATKKLHEQQGKPIPPGLGGTPNTKGDRCCPRETIGDRGR